MKTIKITYTGSKIIPDLDDLIYKWAKKENHKFYASGRNRMNGIRDICFDIK